MLATEFTIEIAENIYKALTLLFTFYRFIILKIFFIFRHLVFSCRSLRCFTVDVTTQTPDTK